MSSSTQQHSVASQRLMSVAILVMLLILIALQAFSARQRTVHVTSNAEQRESAWPDMRFNLNTATVDELAALPGFGPKLAQRVIDHRQSRGKFRSVDELRNVQGIGDSLLEQARPYVVAD